MAGAARARATAQAAAAKARATPAHGAAGHRATATTAATGPRPVARPYRTRRPNARFRRKPALRLRLRLRRAPSATGATLRQPIRAQNRPDRGRGDGNWRGNSGAAPTGTPGRWSNDNRGDNNARDRDNQRDNDNRWRDNDNRWRDRDRDGRNDRDRDRDRWRDNDNRSQTRWRGNDNRWHSNDGWRDRDNRWGNNDRRNWDRDNWRRDNRYDWRSYRDRNRSHYRMGRYYSPYNNWSYRRLSIGFSLGAMFYSDRYWINDPWSYRLPPAYGPYRWVRYYDDALLVDTYTGEVVDVIYDIFW
ncbi:RcnB family protein [Novosphingobium colocasiae]